ncbi:MAG: hypothetical protein WC277_08515, partial [Bacilli bacterium]
MLREVLPDGHFALHVIVINVDRDRPPIALRRANIDDPAVLEPGLDPLDTDTPIVVDGNCGIGYGCVAEDVLDDVLAPG